MKKAFTLLEVLITLALSAVIGIAAFTLYRGGVQSSLSGVVNFDMLAEGRKVIAQIRDDLKHACIPYHGAFSLSFNDLLQIDFSQTRGLEGAEFNLLRFRYEADFARSDLPAPEYLLRPLLSVKYRLEAVKESGLLKLIREISPGSDQAKIEILSERVSFFRINPVKVTGPDGRDSWFWNISLQLSQQTGRSGSTRPDSDKTRGAGSMEFYDVVCSEFFNAINNYRHSPRNWNTGLKYTPD